MPLPQGWGPPLLQARLWTGPAQFHSRPILPEALTLEFNSRPVGVSDSAWSQRPLLARGSLWLKHVCKLLGKEEVALWVGGVGPQKPRTWGLCSRESPFWPWDPQAKDMPVWTRQLRLAIGVCGQSHVSQRLVSCSSSVHQGHCCLRACALAGPLPPPTVIWLLPRPLVQFRAELTTQLLRDTSLTHQYKAVSTRHHLESRSHAREHAHTPSAQPGLGVPPADCHQRACAKHVHHHSPRVQTVSSRSTAQPSRDRRLREAEPLVPGHTAEKPGGPT